MIQVLKLLASIGAFFWACIGIVLVMLAVAFPVILALNAIGVPREYRSLIGVLAPTAIFLSGMSPGTKSKAMLDRLIFPFGSPLEILRKKALGRS